jgi:hypothetical protein
MRSAWSGGATADGFGGRVNAVPYRVAPSVGMPGHPIGTELVQTAPKPSVADKTALLGTVGPLPVRGS